MNALPNWVRWILVLPLAFVAQAVGQILIGVSISEIPLIGEWLAQLMTPILGAVGFVEVGRGVAPSRKTAVGFALASVTAVAALWMIWQTVHLPGFSLGAELNSPMPFGVVRKSPIWRELLTDVLSGIFAFAAALEGRHRDRAEALKALAAAEARTPGWK